MTLSETVVVMMPMDSKAIVILIKLYKDSPVLWDPRNLLYNVKEERKKAYSALLKQFRLCQPNATLDMVKKKIDNLRTTYKRETRKAKAAKAEGRVHYRPTLWYFDQMSFINTLNNTDGGESPDLITTDVEDKDDYEIEESEYVYAEYLEDEPTPKKAKKSDVYLQEQSNEFLIKQENLEESRPKISSVFLSGHGDDEAMINTVTENNESLAFGRTVGLQLKDVDSIQRIIAEKLISDAIFFARLNKLTPNSTLQLNKND